ncbi:MAG: glycosyltransferase family 4 protein, partial [Deferribacteres bacterium]|nr:glycosyltransferase family 4 protein [Deferribacteres bacterium]
ADLFCQVDFLTDEERSFILNKKTKTSLIQNLPFARTKYRNYLPLMPFAAGRLDVSAYDVIISNSHSVAKGVKKKPGQLQICYCHTPMRYAWDLREQYLNETGLNSGIKGAVVKAVLNRLRTWDYNTAQQVDHFIANSRYIKDRISRSYGREATVIYPPVDVRSFQLDEKKDKFFLAVSRMVPYKKMDLIVEAFSKTGLPLVVIGDGPDFAKVRSRAKKNIEFLGYLEGGRMRSYMQKARAFVFAAEEDFGIVPVEAQACGTPVIAYGKGGVTETVIPVNSSALSLRSGESGDMASPTGIFFHEQTPEALIGAVKEFEASEDKFNPSEIRKNAERFSIERFRREFRAFVDEKISKAYG